jgi:formate dehydrogenase alpha subunit
VVGENPVGSLPAAAGAKEALSNLELLVCQELFLTETASLAHVVLPACSYAEKDGTFTNSEGHVQAVRQAIQPIGESRPDWEVCSALSGLMGYPLEYGDAREILKEIRGLIPGYGLLGPAPTPPQVDRAAVERYLSGEYARDLSDRYQIPGKGQEVKSEDKSETLTLVFGQSLFHSGKLSTRSKGLLQVESGGALRMNPADAARHRLSDGDRVRVFNSRGEFTTAVKILARIPEGIAFFPEHFDQDAKALADAELDPVTKVPYFKMAQVRVERLVASGQRQ